MTRRTTLDPARTPSQPTIDLWGLRLLCNCGLWQDLDTSEMGNNDDYARHYFWLQSLREELNWAAAIYRNAKFLATGEVAQGCFYLGFRTFVTRSESNEDGTAPENEPAFVEESKRLEYLNSRVRNIVQDSNDLQDLTTGHDPDSPDNVGQFWKRVCRCSWVSRTLASDRPSSLSRALETLEATTKEPFSGLSEAFSQNLAELRRVFGFSELETLVFAFLLVITRKGGPLSPLMDLFDFSRSPRELIADLAAGALKADRERILECLNPASRLMRSGLVAFNESSDDEVRDHVTFLDESGFCGLLTNTISLEKILERIVAQAPAAQLQTEDYDHLPTVQRVLIPYLKQALAQHRIGANVLLYGPPGTGKTQLSRVVCDCLSARLYEVAVNEQQEGNYAKQTSRLRLWKTASAFLAGSDNTVLAIDEAEDVFNDGLSAGTFFSDHTQAIRCNKGMINNLLENNPVPTFWITNSIQAIDPAMIRRFDLVIEVPAPDVRARRKMVEHTFADKLSATAAERLAQTARLMPAVLSRAAHVADLVGFGKDGINEEDVLGLIDATLQAQQFGALAGSAAVLPPYYDPRFVNADLDLVELAHGLRQAGTGRLCLYGPPGTGKTAYAAWLADALERPLVRKTVAELTSCWVGETEKNIAEAFKEAKRDNAVLLIDEADSFLRDRTLSRASCESTIVNEMLTQIEAFSGYFIATTNLLDSLDRASLRRFDLKAKFDYLRPDQCLLLAETFLKQKGLDLDAAARRRLEDWSTVTPGDFAALDRQCRFRKLQSAEDFVARLADELEVKGVAPKHRIGF